MSSKVRLLPETLVNQIAAGEVVERPASVVKELLENALDAGAREIRIEVREGGRRLIRVSDDGEGMGPEDARAALARYATSKIRDLADLHAVSTYGFRGEALPSIASVSRLRLVTRRSGDLAATEITVTGGAIEREGEAGAPAGTLVEVADLFFNTPARLKFLKSPAVEASHVADAVERIALARPDVGFSLRLGDRVALEARPGASHAERVADVLGPSLGAGLLPFEIEAWGIAACGYLSPPDRTLAAARAIYLFVNGRPVRDRTLHHALVSAAREAIPADRFPAAILHLRLPADAVDVNVHPAKLEVRLRDARAVHDLVRRAILNALRRWSPVPDPGAQAPLSGDAGTGTGALPAERVQESLERFFRSAPSTRDVWRGVAATAAGAEASPARLLSDAVGPRFPEVGPRSAGDAQARGLRYLGQAHDTYLLFEEGDGLLVVDQHAAHERVVFERLRAQAEAAAIPVQRLLVARTIDLSPARRARLDACREALARLGFEIEPFGGSTVAVKSVPAVLGEARIEPVLSAVADDLEEAERPDVVERALRRALATVACHASVRAGRRLGEAEVLALLDQMGGTPGSGTCPHGRPVAVRLPWSGLERMFRRT